MQTHNGRPAIASQYPGLWRGARGLFEFNGQCRGAPSDVELARLVAKAARGAPAADLAAADAWLAALSPDALEYVCEPMQNDDSLGEALAWSWAMCGPGSRWLEALFEGCAYFEASPPHE